MNLFNRNNKALTKLDASCNSFGDDGAIAFGMVVKWNKTLLHLDLSSNKIGDVGGTEFALMLQQNQVKSMLCDFILILPIDYHQVLQELNLRNNSMQETTGEALATYLKGNHSLLSLDIAFNDFDYKHINILEKKIKENAKLYKDAAVDRYKSEIDTLQLDRDKLLRQYIH
jgi:Ran GTPase-activating protein (RanGAP) involved in mRNA processing and transport